MAASRSRGGHEGEGTRGKGGDALGASGGAPAAQDGGYYCTINDALTRKLLAVVFFLDDGKVDAELRYPERGTGGEGGKEVRYLMRRIANGSIRGLRGRLKEEAIRTFAEQVSGPVRMSAPVRMTEGKARTLDE